MAVKKGLIQLYEAKSLMIQSIERCAGTDPLDQVNSHLWKNKYLSGIYGTQVEYGATKKDLRSEHLLWIAVIEQAVFDAYLHTSGGRYPSVLWVAEAREYFETKEFQIVCDLLNVNQDWVRSMANSVKKLAIELRGDEYSAAAVPKPTKKMKRVLPRNAFQMRIQL